MKRILATLILCGAASGAGAQSGGFDGHWGIADVPECLTEDGQFSTCPAIVIENGTFRGEESTCSMSLISVVPGFEAAAVHEFACRGEGETWSFRGLLHLDVDGRLTVLNEFGPLVYLRVAGAPATPAPVK